MRVERPGTGERARIRREARQAEHRFRTATYCRMLITTWRICLLATLRRRARMPPPERAPGGA